MSEPVWAPLARDLLRILGGWGAINPGARVLLLEDEGPAQSFAVLASKEVDGGRWALDLDDGTHARGALADRCVLDLEHAMTVGSLLLAEADRGGGFCWRLLDNLSEVADCCKLAPTAILIAAVIADRRLPLDAERWVDWLRETYALEVGSE